MKIYQVNFYEPNTEGYFDLEDKGRDLYAFTTYDLAKSFIDSETGSEFCVWLDPNICLDWTYARTRVYLKIYRIVEKEVLNETP